ncbi:uncharacterized protein EAF01_002147 [Botrytis porri]|uniref:uncharacterized protein n=1 Tax=Botrytis porri TaxID=87229 RepID=UPI001900514D|nr:uncharacterized protein EAF01_002147 [Botrytis porri]KAF7910637.1 hypothetical protein EAF01_002147 [Botrytis porri]
MYIYYSYIKYSPIYLKNDVFHSRELYILYPSSVAGPQSPKNPHHLPPQRTKDQDQESYAINSIDPTASLTASKE